MCIILQTSATETLPQKGLWLKSVFGKRLCEISHSYMIKIQGVFCAPVFSVHFRTLNAYIVCEILLTFLLTRKYKRIARSEV